MATAAAPLMRRWRHWRQGRDLSVPLQTTSVEDTMRRFLLYGVIGPGSSTRAVPKSQPCTRL
ncbi:hypothetical protein QFZ67_000257 [Streptomyces sp. V1I1]|nr:hypothetical protein [Streptomyces sp. V1I1]